MRKPEQLDDIDALIIPGGESTTIGKLAQNYGIIPKLRERAEQGMPVWGTCAGAIFLAKDVPGHPHPLASLMDMTVERNAFGRQLDSFEADLDVKALGAEPKIVGFNRLYQALAERQVDGQENPLVIAEENKLYEVCKYLSLTNHQWAGFNMLANNAYWQRLPADIQEAVVRNAKIYVAQQRAFVRAANAGLEKTLRDRGMIVNTVDVDSFRKRLIGVNFYRDWRQSIGEKAWALMEEKGGKVG